MLVLTIQEKSIAQRIAMGGYKANFWESKYSCISPSFTQGYNICKRELEVKLGRNLSEDFSPIWAWVGAPYIEFHTYLNEGDLVALFLDIPASEMVFSDYDKYCNFIYGDTKDTDFMVGYIDAKKTEKSTKCIQACLEVIKPSQIVQTVDFVRLDGEHKTIENFYNYLKLISVYMDLRKKIGRVTAQVCKVM